uniref:2-Hacid_dh domain-containing protein n=1 Tax=Panagrellus redivivus TaxID=6233 RepID=A0A7E4ZU66_PANRE
MVSASCVFCPEAVSVAGRYSRLFRMAPSACLTPFRAGKGCDVCPRKCDPRIHKRGDRQPGAVVTVVGHSVPAASFDGLNCYEAADPRIPMHGDLHHLQRHPCAAKKDTLPTALDQERRPLAPILIHSLASHDSLSHKLTKNAFRQQRATTKKQTSIEIIMIQIKSVLIADEIEQECVDTLSAVGIRVDKKTKQSEAQLCEILKSYDAVIVRSATKITSKILSAAAGSLKLVGRAGTGVDNIDVPAATENGVIVMNTPARRQAVVDPMTDIPVDSWLLSSVRGYTFAGGF